MGNMTKKRFILIILTVLSMLLITGYSYAFFAYPHTNISYESSPVECGDCHFGHGDPPWASAPADIDDSFDNNLCQTCHNGVIATDVNTHSSLQTDNGYGDWSVECITCHDTHVHEQIKAWGASSHLTSGVSTSISINDPVAGKSRLTDTGAGWTVDEFQNMMLMPNVSEDSYGYKIENNTSDTLTVKGVIDLSKVTAGVDTFAVIYGRLVRSAVTLDEIITYTSVSTTVTETTLTETGAGWTVDEYAGMTLIPNANTLNPWSYDIDSNTSDTITVSPGSEMLTEAKASNGDTFQIARFASKTGSKSVKLFNATGTNSFADGDGTYDGICEVCHTQTTRHQNSGAGDHTHEAGNNCMGCHEHINGFKGVGECITCHDTGGAGVGGANNRRAVVPEFALTWSHKADDSGTVTNEDCVICHMEGDPATLSTTAVHENGYIDLRDPDTGTTIETVTFSGTPGSYTSSGTPLTTLSGFSRNLASSTLESGVTAIQINHCLKCHDSDGATALAVDGAASITTSPSAAQSLSPFNTTPNHTPGNNVLDVETHFLSSNSSYHPVTAKQNNSYVDQDTTSAPWNQFNKTPATTNQWGDLISCWDCHADPSDSGTITSTVTAHGGTNTLRGTSVIPDENTNPSASNAVTLCVICHPYDVLTDTNPDGHGPDSAAEDWKRGEKEEFSRYGCNMCHSSGYDTPITRPTRAEDVHGNNTLPSTGQTLSGRWASDPTPIAFIRNRQFLGNHEPDSIGATSYQAQCDMAGDNFGNGVCDQKDAEDYSPGGTY